jgi:hypothetical protein
MLGDFNVPKYDLLNGTPLFNCYCHSEIKVNLINATSYFLGLNQHNNSVSNSALFNFVFTNTNDLGISISNYLIVTPAELILILNYPHSQPTSTPSANDGQGDYLLLYNTLPNYIWSWVFG